MQSYTSILCFVEAVIRSFHHLHWPKELMAISWPQTTGEDINKLFQKCLNSMPHWHNNSVNLIMSPSGKVDWYSTASKYALAILKYKIRCVLCVSVSGSCLSVFTKFTLIKRKKQPESSLLTFLPLLPSIHQHHWCWPWRCLAAWAVVPAEPAWYCRCDPDWRRGNTETNRSAGPPGRPRTAQPEQGWIWQEGSGGSRRLGCVFCLIIE